MAAKGAGTAETAVSLGGFTSLIERRQLSAGFVALALLIAMFWGSVHALSPGHGKSLVAAYLVGSRGTARHALFLGATVTVTHTAGVFALGLVALYLSQYIVPETLYPWLSVVSGLMVLSVGAASCGGGWRHGGGGPRRPPPTMTGRAGTPTCRRRRPGARSRLAACWRWASPAACCRARRRWW